MEQVSTSVLYAVFFISGAVFLILSWFIFFKKTEMPIPEEQVPTQEEQRVEDVRERLDVLDTKLDDILLQLESINRSLESTKKTKTGGDDLTDLRTKLNEVIQILKTFGG